MKHHAVDIAFERALSREIATSELMRMRVVAVTLAILLIADQLIFLFARGMIEQFMQKPLPGWLPLRVIGPFLAYETVALLILRYRLARGRSFPTFARYGNALIETSLPTYILWWINQFASPEIAFGAWPAMLYFVFIVASTLRLNFLLPAFTGAVAAVGYLGLVLWVLSQQGITADPLNYLSKAAIMLFAGVVAGLVALRLRAKFRQVFTEAASRERITNLFGQHVSPAVVDRLLERPAEFAGEVSEVCVMFLDIRNFTANARGRPPEEVVEFLNAAFAFMIESIDRQGVSSTNSWATASWRSSGRRSRTLPPRATPPPRHGRSWPRSTVAACPTLPGRSASASGCTSVRPSPAMSARRGARSTPPSATP